MNLQQQQHLGSFFRIKHGYAFKSRFFTEYSKFIVMTPGNFHEVGGFKRVPGKEKFYDGPIPGDFVLSKGDLVIAMTEQGEGLLGSSALIPDDATYLHNQRIGLITELDENCLDKRFLYYLFNAPLIRRQIRASANGVKIRHTSPSQIYQISVSLPYIETQKSIASILSAYDDLIENNTRRIAILEEMARRLYDEWFVQLRFPGSEASRGQNGLPKGWHSYALDQIAADVRHTIAPREVAPETPYVGLEHLPRRSLMLPEWANAESVDSTKLKF